MPSADLGPCDLSGFPWVGYDNLLVRLWLKALEWPIVRPSALIEVCLSDHRGYPRHGNKDCGYPIIGSIRIFDHLED